VSREDEQKFQRNRQKIELAPGEQIEGRNPLQEALRAGRKVRQLYILNRANKVSQSDPLAKLAKQSEAGGASVFYVDRAALDSIAISNAHQGVIAIVEEYGYADLDAVLRAEEAAGTSPFLILLDNLQDAHNLGAILRIADGAGVSAVLIPKHRSVSLNAVVAKTSAGAIEYVPVCQETNLTQTVLRLKEAGFWIYGTSDAAKDKYYDVDWKGKVALIIGSEGRGIGEKLLKHCDFQITIPQRGEINSLNASVACGIITFEAMRQRGL
jgi:23S rRNA (guanosine2251-2'-O)-methyltransferase